METNSNRSIDLAFLVKKNLPFEATAISHRESPLTIDSYQNSGLAVRFSQNSNLQLILLLTHLKSKISTDHWRCRLATKNGGVSNQL